MNLRRKTLTGLAWNFFEQLGSRGITGLVTIVLAKFLLPGEFGIFGMLAVFLQLANTMMDSGFLHALIQRKNPTQQDYSTVFYSNLILGSVSYTLLFLCAPLVANFYNELRLTEILRVVGISIIINSFKVVQEAIFIKQLNFKAIVIASLPGSIISGIVAVVLAVLGYGVWALIVQVLIASLVTTVVLWFQSGWIPSLIFSVDSFRNLFGYGSKLFVSGIIDTMFQNVYIIVFAKLFSSEVAGYYFIAHRIRQLLVFQLTTAVQTVAFPALSIIQDDKKRLKSGFRELLRMLVYIMFPIILLPIGIIGPVVKVLLAENWLPLVKYVQILLLAGMLVPLHSVNLTVLKVMGRSDLFLIIEIIKKILIVAVLLISTKFGILAIMYGQIISTILAYLPNSYFTKKLINYSQSEQLHDLLVPFFCAGGITFAITIINNNYNVLSVLNITIMLLSSFLAYFGITFFGFSFYRETIKKIIVSR